MIPINSIATIDDLIVALLRLGYKKRYEEFIESKEASFFDADEEDDRNTFRVFRVPHRDMTRVFIHYRNEPIHDVYVIGDVFLTAEVVGEFYPHIKQWYVSEICGGTDWKISWEDAEFIDLENVDQYLNKTIKEWDREKEDAK